MLNSHRAILIIVAMAALGVNVAHAKPDYSPIRVEFTVPEGLRTGDEVTTTLRFRALVDVAQLDVHVGPARGIELLSAARDMTVRDIRRDSAAEMQVRVRLTDPKCGSLGVSFKTQSRQGPSAGAVSIAYGDSQ